MSGSAEIDVVILGLSHKTAPVAMRERLAVVPEQADDVLRSLVGLPGLREAALLSTCNRVEIYAVASDKEAALRALAGDMARRAGIDDAELDPHIYTRVEREAVHHLFRVAASLDSLVIGEPQILGQVKTTHESALRVGTSGPILDTCFQRAFRIARRVRRETAIAKNPVSISSVAVELARNVFEDFEGKRVLVVGAGKMSDLAARALRTHGAELTITNRTRARAEELAARFEAEVHAWEDLAGALTVADIVIASTGAREPVLTQPLLTRVQRARRGRPLFLIDIAVPRDVDPACGELEGIYLADIDQLQKVAAEHREGRQSEAEQAEAIVEQELVRFVQAFKGRQLGPTVTALRSHVLNLCKVEAEKITGSIADERVRRAVLDLADSIGKKLLHAPQMALKKDSDLVQAVQTLFQLSVEPLTEVEADDDAAEASDTKKASGR